LTENSPSLPPRLAISDATLKDGVLTVRGWKLCAAEKWLLIIKDEKGKVLDGPFTHGLRRLDVANNYPDYYDSASGWEFTCEVREDAPPTKLNAELSTTDGKTSASKAVTLVVKAVRPAPVVKVAPPLITVKTVRFEPKRRLILATGALANDISVKDLIFSSSVGRLFNAPQIKESQNPESGERHWHYRAGLAGFHDGEKLIVEVPTRGISASAPLKARDADAVTKLATVTVGATQSDAQTDMASEIDALEALRETTTIETATTGSISYFPRFDSVDELTNHFFRAAWYLTGAASTITQVTLGVTSNDISVAQAPDFFCAAEASLDALSLEPAEMSYLEKVLASQLVLVWKDISAAALARLRALIPNAQIFTVATHALSATEYGNYCKAQWTLLERSERERLLMESKTRFTSSLARLRAEGKEAAAVFGTGPSIEKAFDYDFSKCATIVCNTIVADDELLDHVKPAFICAGDVVSHFGVSRYAERFRTDLVRVLRTRDILFFTSAPFGYLLAAKFPDIADKIIFCEQRHNGANTDLESVWALPKLDSTLNIHMLPIASTFAKAIFVLGCDGKNPDASKNEDFWAHSPRTHYHDLVDTGHQSHPTFDQRRQASTFNRYVDSTEESFQAGESQGRIYFAIEPSFTPALKARPVPPRFLAKIKGGRKRIRGSSVAAPSQVLDRKNIVLIGRSAPDLFSGGRYHAAMIAVGLAMQGHDVTMWLNNKPYWWHNLALVPGYESIKFWLNEYDIEPDVVPDVVFIIPGMESEPDMYHAALSYAQFHGARVVLLNFETPNWYNSLSPAPRPAEKWANWYATSTFCDAILSSAEESTKFAREFYDTTQDHCLFVSSAPSINDFAASVVRAKDIPARKQIICISRFGAAASHKNMDAVVRLLPDAARGYALALIYGTGAQPDAKTLEDFRAKLARKGVTLRLLHGISDIEKFEEIAKSRLMVFQSFFEGFGYPPVEAQYMDRPCVVFDLPVLREFSDGRLSFVAPSDYHGFRKAVHDLLVADKRGQMAGLHEAVKPFATIESFAVRLQSMLNDLFAIEKMAADHYTPERYLAAKAACEHVSLQDDPSPETLPLAQSGTLRPIRMASENADVMDTRLFIRNRLREDPEATVIELAALMAEAPNKDLVKKVLTLQLDDKFVERPELVLRASATSIGARSVALTTAAMNLMEEAKWALPATFNAGSFIADAVQTCETPSAIRALLLSKLTTSKNRLDLRGAQLTFTSEGDIGTLFDEIVLRKSYHFKTSNESPYIIDAGANIGMATYAFLRQYPRAHIVAFEPGRSAAKALQQNKTQNNWNTVEIQEKAISGTNSTVSFHEPNKMSMGGTITDRLSNSAYSLTSYDVECVTLSSFIDRPVDMLKLDIEGEELRCLQEIRGKLDKVARMFVEVHGSSESTSVNELRAVLDILNEAGFRSRCEPARLTSQTDPFAIDDRTSYVVWARR
jgi:FkbM family methyltransferase